jgi:hypothetical protein
LRFGGVNETEALVQRWISEWAQESSSWERIWQDTERTVETLYLLDDFFSPPTYEAQQGGEVAVRLRARPGTTMWKDWMAKFVEDFNRAHPGATLLKVQSGY